MHHDNGKSSMVWFLMFKVGGEKLIIYCSKMKESKRGKEVAVLNNTD